MNPLTLWASVLIAGISSAVAQTPADVYKPGNDVSTPVVVTDVKPSYPPAVMRRGLSGAVKLECIVETDGTVSAIRVTTPLDPDLDAAAVAALNQWRFKPALKDGKAVRASIDVEMTFTMRGPGPRLDSAEVKAGPGVRMPRLLKEVKPSYPVSKRGSGIQGMVTLDCIVLADGTVGEVRVARGIDPDLDLEAIRAMRQWRFTPGERDGKPVPVQVSVEMSFTLK